MNKEQQLLNNKYFVYFLGYFWADGYLSKDRYAIMLSICKDEAIQVFKYFKKFQYLLDRPFTLNFNKPPKNPNWNIMSRIYSSDHTIYNLLKNNDFCNKSDCQPLKILSKIPLELHHYFYLGYIDGDGCFSIGKNCLYNFSITANFNYNWHFVELLLKSLDISYKIGRFKRKIGANSSILVYGMYNIRKLGDYLYKDNELEGLSRKKSKYLYIKERSLIPASQHKRVFFCKTTNKFKSYVVINNKQVSLGTFDSEKEALQARILGDRLLKHLNKF